MQDVFSLKYGTKCAAFCAVLGGALPALAADAGYSPRLQAVLGSLHAGEFANIGSTIARSLYLESTALEAQSGGAIFSGCAKAHKNKYARLPTARIAVTRYKNIPIIGSPYYSTPVETRKNNNALYFKRLIAALRVIERVAPLTFSSMNATMKKNNGYLVIGNFCPFEGALALGAFVVRPKVQGFVVMVSSTQLLLSDLFRDYDIAATLVHEVEGHATGYFNHGRTDEITAFGAQAAFAKTVGDDKFMDANNRSFNIQAKIKMKLSTTGLYVVQK